MRKSVKKMLNDRGVLAILDKILLRFNQVHFYITYDMNCMFIQGTRFHYDEYEN